MKFDYVCFSLKHENSCYEILDVLVPILHRAYTAYTLDYFYPMTLRIAVNHFLGEKTSRFSHLLRSIIKVCNGRHYIRLNVTKSVNHKWFCDFIA